jgi:30S ribosomal protein S31
MGKGDKKSKRGKIIMGSYGVRRPSRKLKGSSPVSTKAEEKTKKTALAIEVPVEVPVTVVEEPRSEEKKTTRKAPAKKVAEGETEKPKAVRTKKKATPEGETLFDQKEEPAAEK